MVSRRRNPGFTLLELLISTAILIIILGSAMRMLDLATRTFRETGGKLEAFEASRAAFDTMARTLRQATLLSHLGYDDPTAPTGFQLKSDLHFLCGPQASLGLAGPGADTNSGIFFQAPLGVADSGSTGGKSLMNAVGYFVAWGDVPGKPPILSDNSSLRDRWRLYQFLPPREHFSVYDSTLILSNGIPSSNPGFAGTAWFQSDVNSLRYCQPLAENVVALAILPVKADGTVTNFWNSRDSLHPESLNRLPHALRIAMAVIDESSAQRAGDADLVPPGLLDAESFDALVEMLEHALATNAFRLNYRIFTAEIPLHEAP